MLTVILTLFALLFFVVGILFVYVGIRMLRPSNRSTLQRNAETVGSWRKNMSGNVAALSGRSSLTRDGMTYDPKTKAFTTARRLSDDALLEML